MRSASALLQIVFQFVLISCGNLAFLNWLTICPAFFCLSDAAITSLSPARLAAAAAAPSAAWTRWPVQLALAALLGWHSIPVVRNLLAIGGRQQMNAAFSPWRFVNSYGAPAETCAEREPAGCAEPHAISTTTALSPP